MVENLSEAVQVMLQRADQRSGDVSGVLRLYGNAADRIAVVPVSSAAQSIAATGLNAFVR